MHYRSDIDGLRAFAVLVVIAFHAGLELLPGGFVGVDIFFVISGYLITSIIYREMTDGTFSFQQFYQRRIVRLLPALILVLVFVLLFGFVFYNNAAFDALGREVVFSAFGALNILYAQGLNYFAKNESIQPLIHLWSLGVEEQFYLIWPVILLLTFRFAKRAVLPVAGLLLFISFCLSEYAVSHNLTKGYFLLHFRAFELLVGVVVALILPKIQLLMMPGFWQKLLSYIGFLLVLTPVLLLDNQSAFPGFNALWPCIGAALLIMFPSDSYVTKLLSAKYLVFIGLISYPLYLFHQPIISFIHFFNLLWSPAVVFLVTCGLAGVIAWGIYEYIETPLRKSVHHGKSLAWRPVAVLICCMPILALSGLFIAKTQGLETRFKYLNAFASDISEAHADTFLQHFESGYQVSATAERRVLFVGDSVLQHYILPFTSALQLRATQIDMVTRGGCVLLKNAEFVDGIAGTSCSELRSKLYEIDRHYDYVVISQAWNYYEKTVLNFLPAREGYEKWEALLQGTVEHFSKISDQVIVIAAHPVVDGVGDLQPSLMMTEQDYLNSLDNIKIKNMNDLLQTGAFFQKFGNDKIKIIEPYHIFCESKCMLRDQRWSYFRDAMHLSSAATPFVTQRIQQLLTAEVEGDSSMLRPQ